MHIDDNRYQRDRLRYDLALRLMQHEARTQTIRHWTGLNDNRIRHLYHSYLREKGGKHVVRHRGRTPHQPALFVKSIRSRREASLLASFCQLAGLLTRPEPGRAREPARLQRGQMLCDVYEWYRTFVPDPLLSVDHTVLLVRALTRADEIQLTHCPGCSAAIVADRFACRPTRCFACSDEGDL
jgi:Flagellar transcriptional activator (FlhC)